MDGDDSASVEIPGDYRALMNNGNGAADANVFAAIPHGEKSIGHQIMERKRLRIF